MQQTTSRQLFAYWDRVRNGRLAPRRFEIEPAQIAPLLPETFIVECEGVLSYRFRLAGTRICEHFGRELRGTPVLELWSPQDRHAMASLLRQVVRDAGAGVVLFHAHNADHRQAGFELLVLPLIHAGGRINRLLGSIAAIDPPFWLGAQPITELEIADVNLVWPDGEPAPHRLGAQSGPGPEADAEGLRKRFRVYPGGAG